MRRTAGIALLGLLATGLASGAAAPITAPSTEHCPKAESLVSRAHWHHHRLARGIRLAQATVHDGKGTVSLHVVRVRLDRRSVAVRPLVHKLTERMRLTQLAAGHRRLRAAINTGYFDFVTGAPTGPIIVAGRALVLSAARQRVVGLDGARHAESGRVWLAAQLVAGQRRAAIESLNELRPAAGLAVYSPRWGSRQVHLGNGLSREVSTRGRTLPIGRHRTVPPHGYLLVSHGPVATHTLHAIGTGTSVKIHAAIRTTARHPFRQAYGVGATLVKRTGKPRSGFTCDTSSTATPARTAIGYAHHGHRLVLVVVDDRPHTRLHGLDNTQLSRVMTDLGVSKAFDFDGSGSAEMVARLHPGRPLSQLTYPSDGVQRPMPLGLGVFSRS